ncbi:MAG: enoyl-CoA hydratase/isomerase family protein, partial [Halomonas sp.]
MSQAPLLYTVEDGVARITLNRPDSLNSFNTEMHAEMRKALKAVRQDSSVRA